VGKLLVFTVGTQNSKNMAVLTAHCGDDIFLSISEWNFSSEQYIYIYIQDVPLVKATTSGECSLC